MAKTEHPLSELFIHFSPEEAVDILRTWFEATITDGFTQLDPEQRAEIVSLYELLQASFAFDQ